MKMSILKLKTVLMLVFTTIITGCASTVTHNYAHFQPMSQEEAIRLVSELGNTFISCNKLVLLRISSNRQLPH